MKRTRIVDFFALFSALMMAMVSTAGCATGKGAGAGVPGWEGAGFGRDTSKDWMMPTGVVLGTAGLGALAAGSGHLILGEFRRSDARAAAADNNPTERDHLIGEAERADEIAVWTMGFGIPFAIAGVLLLALSGGGDAPEAPVTTDSGAVAPVMTLGGGPGGSMGASFRLDFQ